MRSYPGHRLLGYGDVQGAYRSRKILADYLQQPRGLNGAPEQILFTRGSRMGVYLFFRTLLRPGDKVLVSTPNYDAADWVIEAMGGVLAPIPVDADGMDMDQTEDICRREKVRAAYIRPVSSKSDPALQ